jgi:hypothetical protein
LNFKRSTINTGGETSHSFIREEHCTCGNMVIALLMDHG